MSIKSNIPQIVILRTHVEARFGKRLIVHADFIALVSAIEEELGFELAFDKCAHSSDEMLRVRERINSMIKAAIKNV